MKVLIFTGAGASFELGVPTMRPMVEQFRDHLHDLALPANVIEKIDKLVGDGSKDMEHAIDVIDRLEGGYEAKVELGESPEESEIAPYRTIRQEAEWFIQHSCEQIKAEAAIRMWSPVLRAALRNRSNSAVIDRRGRYRISWDSGRTWSSKRAA
jgi:hypothetical protein